MQCIKRLLARLPGNVGVKNSHKYIIYQRQSADASASLVSLETSARAVSTD